MKFCNKNEREKDLSPLNLLTLIFLTFLYLNQCHSAFDFVKISPTEWFQKISGLFQRQKYIKINLRRI